MAIVAAGVSHVYMKDTPFEKVALNNVSFEIKDGEFVAIIGHTGSGKSTLIQHFNGLLKPTSGSITVNGFDISAKNLKELRRQVGIVFQYPEHQLFEETVFKDISFGLLKMGLKEVEIRDRVMSALTAVGLDGDMLEKSPFELSGGQKRRVAIAGVLAMRPDIIVLDEPTAGLDPRGRDEIFGFIARLHREKGLTIILVSHSMEDVARLVDRVIVMNRGGIELDGPVSEVFRDIPRLEAIGLSAPQIAHLMKRLKSVLPEINDNVYTVAGAKQELLKYLKKSGC